MAGKQSFQSIIDDMRQKVQTIVGEVNDEEREVDEPELSELDEIGEFGKSFEENIEEMAEVVKEKHQDLESAKSDLRRLDSLFSAVEGHRNPKFGEDTFNEMRERISSARQKFNSAKQAEGEIEGLREEAEHILREQLNDLEELGEAESNARNITSDATARLTKLEQEEESLMEKIERLEEKDNRA